MKFERDSDPLSFTFNICYKDLDNAIKQEKDIKGLKSSKEEIKCSLSLYVKNPKEPTDKIVSSSATCKMSRDKAARQN